MLTLGIDPGSRSSGLSIYDSELGMIWMDCIKVKAAKGSTVRGRLIAMAERLETSLRALKHAGNVFDRVAIEWQQIRVKGGERGDPSKIVDLNAVSGAAAVLVSQKFPHAETIYPTPHDWKGDVPKSVHHERMKLYPDLARWEEFEMCKTDLKDALDAAGLARWVCRLTRVVQL